MNKEAEGIKRYIYCYYNKVGRCFYVPFVNETDEETIIKQLTRTCKIDKETSKGLRHLELYVLGYMDDLTGIIVPEKKYLIDIDDLLVDQEGDNDGKQN